MGANLRTNALIFSDENSIKKFPLRQGCLTSAGTRSSYSLYFVCVSAETVWLRAGTGVRLRLFPDETIHCRVHMV